MSILVKGKELAKMAKEKGLAWVLENLQESFDKKEISIGDFSIRELWSNMIEGGHEMLDDWSRTSRGGFIATEAVHAVDTSAMANITGQLFFNAIKDNLTPDELIGDRLVKIMPSNILGEELVPGIGGTEDEFAQNVTEGEPYPSLGLTEEFVTIPATEKKGGILGLTKEVILADRTGLIIQRGRQVGMSLAIRKEKSILDGVLGVTNPYRYKGEARLTYGDGTTGGQAMGFLNEATDKINDYTDLQNVADIFFAQRDPITNEPFAHSPTTIICGKTPTWTHRAVIHDTEVRLGDITTGPAIQSIGANRIPWNLEILSNEWVIQRLLLAHGTGVGITAANRTAANLYWLIGKPKEAFVWKETWPLTVEEAPSNSEAEFTQDIVFRVKASYRGVFGVLEPRLMVRSTGQG